jgi:hypothetical protein
MFMRLAREAYGFEPESLHALPDSDAEAGAAAYRVDTALGPVAILRAFRDDYRPPQDFRYFYPWTCTDSTCDVSMWLRSRADTLAFLERARYPAPRIIPTRLGESVARLRGWHLFATSFVPGAVLRPTLDQLRSLATTVGGLHTLSLDQHATDDQPGRSYWYPDVAIPGARELLAATGDLLPAEWRAMHAAFGASIEGVERAIRRGDLRVGVIHGDVWAANAVATDATDATDAGGPILEVRS